MYLADGMTRLVAFFRAGYPTGMPATGYVPLVALLPRRLCDDEISAIASQLAMTGRHPVNTADVGVCITRVTGEMPSPDDIARIQRQLEVDGPPHAFR